MDEIVNPYIAGAPVTEARMFFGREDVFDWIRNNLSGRYADHILVLHGQRRVGKTSVLKQLGNRLPERFIPVFFDFQGRTHTTLDRFLWWLAREIVRGLKQAHNLDVPLPEKGLFTADLEYFEHQFIPGLKPILGDHSLLLTFDEFDNLEESEVREALARPLIDYLRRLLEQQGLNFIFSIGSSGRKLENMQAAYTDFFKTALYKKISFLSEDESRNLITLPVEGLINYQRPSAHSIYQIASGHPYFTQLICHELFARCQRTGQREIGKSDVEAVLDDVVERGTVNLKFLWDEAADLEKWSLAALAQLGPADSRGLADFLRKQRVRFSDSNLTSALLHLREKDVLTPDNHFVIHLLKLWLCKNRPLEQVREELTEINPIANRYIEIGMEFKDSGVYEKAIESFQEALAVAPENAQALVNIALVYMEQKSYEKAVVEFEKALAIDDEDVAARSGLCEAHLAIGNAAADRGRIREGTQSFQRVLSINAEHTEARQRLAEIQRQQAEKALKEGRDEQALSAFAEALKYTPEDPILIERVQSVQSEKKAKVLASLVAKSEKEISAKNLDSAAATLEEALRLAPEDAALQKRLAEVRQLLQTARLEILRARSKQMEAEKNWEAAIASLKEYLALMPDDESVQKRLAANQIQQREAQRNSLQSKAQSLSKAEKFSDALTAWNELLLLAPDDAEMIRGEMGKVESAQSLAQTYSEAQRAMAKKNYAKAIGLMKSIVINNPDYKDASQILAQAVELRQKTRKFWQSRWLWGGVGAMAILVLGGLALQRMVPSSTSPTAVSTQPTSLSNLLGASPTRTVTAMPLPTLPPTPIPFQWIRLNAGQFLTRSKVTAIKFDPEDPGIIYAGTADAGVYKTIDGGASWFPAHAGLESAAISTLAIDPNNPQILYASVLPGGIYKTTDGGANWKSVNSANIGWGFTWFSGVTISPTNSNNLYYLNSNVYQSFDGGDSWRPSTFCDGGKYCPPNAGWIVESPVDPQTLFVSNFGLGASDGGVFRSTDGGDTWSLASPKIEDLGWGENLQISRDGNTIIAYARDGVHVSSDGGSTWTHPLTGVFTACAISPQDGRMIVCGKETNDLFKSIDAGKHWQKLPWTNGTIIQIAIKPGASDTILVGGEVVYESVDGGSSWTDKSDGLGGFRTELLLNQNSGDTNSFYLQGQRTEWPGVPLFYSPDKGKNWSPLTQKGYGLAFSADGQTLFRSDFNGLLRSQDGGKNWASLPGVPDPISPGIVAAHPSIDGKVYLPYFNRILISLDKGNTWKESGGFPTDELRQGETISLFFGSDTDVYVYGNEGDYPPYRSSDSGETWSNCNPPGDLDAFTETISMMAVNPQDRKRIWAATRGGGVMASPDGCLSWTRMNTGLRNLFAHAIAIDPNNPQTMYAGTNGGVYISFDAGQHWDPINDGLLGATVVYSIVIDTQSNVYASTPYGIFKLEGT
ncbi:MAG: tetratricopeptide repeat protein [Anaerolineales bacterium]|nr:tetratricopeptide repeat protein [Anaerolineales bacterium]